MISIYIIQNSINLKVYIGQTINFKKRIGNHKSNKKNHPLYDSIRKHGFDKFTAQIIEEFDNQIDADEAEIFWISFFNSTNSIYGYNLEFGGKLNNRKITYRKEIGLFESSSGENCYLSKLTDEQVKYLRDNFIKLNKTTLDIGKDYNMTGSCIRDIIANKSYKDKNYDPSENYKFLRGRKLIGDTITDQNGNIYNSVRDAAKFTNTDRNHVIRSLKKGIKTNTGYTFKYV